MLEELLLYPLVFRLWRSPRFHLISHTFQHLCRAARRGHLEIWAELPPICSWYSGLFCIPNWSQRGCGNCKQPPAGTGGGRAWPRKWVVSCSRWHCVPPEEAGPGLSFLLEKEETVARGVFHHLQLVNQLQSFLGRKILASASIPW